MSHPLIAVSIGNTRVKLATPGNADAGELPSWSCLLGWETAAFDGESLRGRLPEEPRSWRVSSVHRPCESRLAQWVKRHRPRDEYRLLTVHDLRLAVDVDVPARVGMDRLVAAIAANRLREPQRPAIVVDAGTATTVDALTADGVFRGGVILPGFRMTARALAADTDLLPLVEATFPDAPPPVIGRSTESAIRSGMFWGGVGAIRELVTRFDRQLGTHAQLFVTGGDAQLLAGFVDEQARFVPELVLAGIVWATP